STPATESTQQTNVKSGSAVASAAIQRRAEESTTSLATMKSRTPNARYARAWLTVATVTAQAPDANWRANNCGAIWVLPWGASSTPLSRHQPAIVSALCDSASSRRTQTGPSTPASRSLGAEAHTWAGV